MSGRSPNFCKVYMLLWLSFLLMPVTSYGYILQATENGHVIKWHESCLKYSIYQDGAPGVESEMLSEAIRSAFDAWEDVECSYFFMDETETATCDEVGFSTDTGNTNLLVWRTSDWERDSLHELDALALTTLSFDRNTGRILDADIEFNSEYFEFGLQGNTDIADIQNTATHEIGHMLGLEHSEVEGATMFSGASPGETSKRILQDDDKAGLCALYPLSEDPDECTEPICGLDLHCATTRCEDVADESSSNKNSCSFSPSAHRQSHVSLLAGLLRIFPHIPDHFHILDPGWI